MPQMREITSGLKFPEGPVAMNDGSVLVVEVTRGTLTRVRPNGSKEVVAETGGGPNGAAIGPDGKVYLAAGQIYIYQPDGSPAGEIDVPERPISIVFGGKDRRTLFILARTSLYSVALGKAN